MAPGQPHLLTRGVKGDRKTGQYPITRPDWVVLQEHPRLGIDERRRVPVSNRNSLRNAGGARGEDDPGVVTDRGWAGAPAARRTRAAAEARFGDHPDDPGFAEYQLGPLLRIVGVHRHIGRTSREHRQDGHVQRVAARGHPDSNPVAPADSPRGQPAHTLLDIGDHLRVCQLHRAVIDAGGVRVARGSVVENVDQSPRGRGLIGSQIVRGNPGQRHACES